MPPIMVEITSNLPAMLAVKEASDNTRYKQQDIAEATGISPSIISKWMKGGETGDSTLNTAARLSVWLGCELNQIAKVKIVQKVGESTAG